MQPCWLTDKKAGLGATFPVMYGRHVQTAGEFDIAVDPGLAPIKVSIVACLLGFRLNIHITLEADCRPPLFRPTFPVPSKRTPAETVTGVSIPAVANSTPTRVGSNPGGNCMSSS